MDPDTALASMRAAIETLRNPLDPVVTDDSERVWATKLRTAVDALTTIRERELPGPFAVRDCDVADSALRVIEGMC